MVHTKKVLFKNEQLLKGQHQKGRLKTFMSKRRAFDQLPYLDWNNFPIKN